MSLTYLIDFLHPPATRARVVLDLRLLNRGNAADYVRF